MLDGIIREKHEEVDGWDIFIDCQNGVHGNIDVGEGDRGYVGVFTSLVGMHWRCLSHMILNMGVFVERSSGIPTRD